MTINANIKSSARLVLSWYPASDKFASSSYKVVHELLPNSYQIRPKAAAYQSGTKGDSNWYLLRYQDQASVKLVLPGTKLVATGTSSVPTL